MHRTSLFRLLSRALAIGGLVACWSSSRALADSLCEQEPIRYSSPEVDDPVSRLQQRLSSGEFQLEYDSKSGYLKSILKALGVPESSQALVFSKTSFQRDRISPETPRALYFNDEVYVGWVRWGEVVELSAVDPQKGAIFYTLSQEKAELPVIRRHTHECLQCHESGLSQGVPGHIVRSVFTDPRGQAVLSAGTYVTNHNSPFAERWGGWYVTGSHGSAGHMGNQTVSRSEERTLPAKFDYARGANRNSLDGLCDTTAYLSPHSDLVALMVLEHQTHGQNLLTVANYQARLALRDEESMNRALGRNPEERLDSTTRRIKSAAEPLVKYLLYLDEPALKAPIAGTSRFASEFPERGPRDRQGRSLRDLDLNQRLFKYPLSYLVYSPAFEGLPRVAREYVYQRLAEILSGKDANLSSRISAEQRTAVREILQETKTDLPENWGK
jgi:hypothetical protein